MADDRFENVPDLVPISATGEDQPVPAVDEVVNESVAASVSELPPPEGFTPKEIQASVFSASVQIYNSRKDERDYDAKVEAVKDAATLFAISGNKQLMAGMFEQITMAHSHPYDVFARAQMEIEGVNHTDV